MSITSAQLRQMADQLEAAQNSILSKLTGTGVAPKVTKTKKKGMSAATKAKLRRLAKARWAARRKEGKTTL